MIISATIGGLGNQLFQYAAGRILAEKNNTDLLVDTRLFNGYSLHNGFELQRVFEIDSRIATTEEVRKLIGWRASRVGRRILADKRFSLLEGRHYYKEKNISFEEEFLLLPNNSYISGYWQSEKYFKSYEGLIREQFRFRTPPKERNKELVQFIQGLSKAVSIHVRRGDYVANSKTYSVHWVCSINYYKAAMEFIEERVEQPIYFVFSDDVDWVRGNLNIKREHHYIHHNADLDSYK